MAWKSCLITLVVLLASLCAQPALAAKDTLVVSQNTAATTMHPLALTMTPEQSISCNMYDGLVDRDYDGDLVPSRSLATSWIRDGKIWRFNLRKGVVWHNGDPFRLC